MKNKKSISFLLVLAMLFTFVCPAFASVTEIKTDQDTYYFGDTVTVTGKSTTSEMYALSNKDGAKNIIIMDSFERDANGEFEFDIKIPNEENGIWPAGTYTVETNDNKATFEIVNSLKYNITVDQTSHGDTEVDKEEAVAGAKVTITANPDNGYQVEEVTVKGEDGTKIKAKKQSSKKYYFTMPAQDVTVKVTYEKKTSGGGGGGGGGGIIINNGSAINSTISTNGVSAVMNPNQYSKFGVDASAVSVKAAKLSDNTFSITASINGQKYVNFDGYNAIMAKIPYTPKTANTSNIVVVDQFGNVVPRSLYKNGYMYMATDDISGVFTIKEISKSFSDTNIDWANQAISALAARDIISGMGDGTFAPNNAVTRAQFVKMIVAMLDIKATGTAVFTDVSADQWFAPYVATAQALGITAGYEDGTFRPDQIITREEMSAMLYRAATVMSVDMPAVKSMMTFADDWNISDYAKTAVYKMQTAGIINGIGDNMFDAKGSCTRAQAAVAIWNMFQVTMNF